MNLINLFTKLIRLGKDGKEGEIDKINSTSSFFNMNFIRILYILSVGTLTLAVSVERRSDVDYCKEMQHGSEAYKWCKMLR